MGRAESTNHDVWKVTGRSDTIAKQEVGSLQHDGQPALGVTHRS